MHKKHDLVPIDMRNKSHPKIIMNIHQPPFSVRRPSAAGLWAVFIVLCTLVLTLPAQAASANFEKVSATITAESCLDANGQVNGAVDPGETNTVRFVVKKTTDGSLSNVKFQLVESGGVSFLGANPGKVTGSTTTVAKDGTVEVTFTFITALDCKSSLIPTLQITSGTDDAVDEGTVAFDPMLVGKVTAVAHPIVSSAAGTLTIKDNDKASIYPWKIAVPDIGLNNGRQVKKVEVTLNGVNHDYARDIDILLKGPNGKVIVLMSDAGGASAGTDSVISNATLTFTDSAAAPIPANAKIVTGSYKPANYEPADTFPDAPAVSTTGGVPDTTLSAFNDLDPKGDWELFVKDDEGGDAGTIASWSIKITTEEIICCISGAPTITRISNQEIDEDGTLTLSFDVRDIVADSTGKSGGYIAGASVTGAATATSDNTALVPNIEDNIKVDPNTGQTRTLTVKPAADKNSGEFGTANITLRFTDPEGKQTSSSFVLNVKAVNDQPVITFTQAIPNQSVNVGTSSDPVPFTMIDADDPDTVPPLTITANSTVDSVVPDANIFITGSGPNFEVRVVPASSSTSGETEIQLTPSDNKAGGTSVTKTFKVNFGTPTGKPTITPINNFTVKEDEIAEALFRVSDTSTPAGSLVVRVVSATPADKVVSASVARVSGGDFKFVLDTVDNFSDQISVILEVEDADGNKTQNTTPFVVTFEPVNDDPTITGLPTDATTDEDVVKTIEFDIEDPEKSSYQTLANTLTADFDPAVIASVSFNKVDQKRQTMTITPVLDKIGKTTITVNITDHQSKTVSPKLALIINAINDNPTITAVNGTAGDVTPSASNVADADVILVDAQNETDGTVERTITLKGVSPGAVDAKNEVEQTVTVAATSSNTALIPSFTPATSPLTFTTAAPTADVQLKYKPTKEKNGDTIVTLDLTDSLGAKITRKFKVRVNPINSPPTIETADSATTYSTPVNVAKTIAIKVRDNANETPAAELDVTVVAADGNTVGITGSGENRQVTVKAGPTKVAGNSSLITVRVTDKGDSTAAALFTDLSFTVSFTAEVVPNEAPAFVDITTTQTTKEDTALTLTITTTDPEGDARTITKKTSNRQDIIPDANIAIVGDMPAGATTRSTTLVLVPKDNASGDAEITLEVTDTPTAGRAPALTDTMTIKVSVTAENDAPVLTITGTFTGTDTANSRTIDEGGTVTVELKATDVDNATVTLTAKTLANTTLVPDADASFEINGVVTRSATVTQGATVTVKIKPATEEFGTGGSAAQIELKASDGSLSDTENVTVNVNSVNDKPTMNAVADITVAEDAFTTSVKTVQLTGLSAGPANEVQTLSVVSVTTDKPALITDLSVTSLNATDKTANLNFKTGADQFGTGEITITLGDGVGADNQAFKAKVIVTADNDVPTIAFNPAIPAAGITIAEDSQTSILTFTIDDKDNETPEANLVVQAFSTNKDLVPETSANLQLGGTGASRSLIVVPAKDRSSTTEIKVVVTDLGSNGSVAKSAEAKFTLNVTESPDAPTIVSVSPSPVETPVNQETGIITIVVNDPEDSVTGTVNTVKISATSSDPSVIPNSPSNIQFNPVDGTGSTSSPTVRQMILIPAKDAFGTTTITLTARDTGGLVSATKTLTVQVKRQNTLPVISGTLADQTINEGATVATQTVTISDNETASGFLQVSVASTDNAIAQPSFTKSGSTVTVSAVGGKEGTATVQLKVVDTDGGEATKSFNVTVRPSNVAPTVTLNFGNQTTSGGKTVGPLSLTLADDTATGFLTLSRESSDPTIVPVDNIVLDGTGANRTVTVTALNKAGTTVIKIIAEDSGGKKGEASFSLTVTPNTAPTITGPIATQTLFTGQKSGNLSVTVGDAESDAASITVTASSDSTAVATATVEGTGSTRTVVATAGSTTGTAKITVRASDGDLSATLEFNVVVNVSPSAEADFNGDGKSDLLFQDNDGFLAAWFMNGANQIGASFLIPSNLGDPAWRIAGTGDFDRDGQTDVLFQNTDGNLAVWYMDGVAQRSPALLGNQPGDANWRVVGTGDLNGDSSTDLVFQHTSGLLGIWYMDGINQSGLAVVTPDNPGEGWKVAGVGDTDGDDKEDLIFQHTDGTIAVWAMDGATKTVAAFVSPTQNPGSDWKVTGAADMDGNGKADLILQHTSGTSGIWFMNGATATGASLLDPSNPGGSWKIVAPK